MGSQGRGGGLCDFNRMVRVWLIEMMTSKQILGDKEFALQIAGEIVFQNEGISYTVCM